MIKQIKNIKHNSFANSFGFAVSMVVQFLTVGVLVRFWGANEYGQWVVLYTIPAYISLADFGVSSVAAYLLVPLYINKNTSEFNRVIFNCYFILFLALSAVLLVFCLCDSFGLINISHTGDFILYSVLCIFSKLPVSIIRSVGKYSEITYINDSLVLMESLLMLGVVYFGGHIAEAVLALIFARIVINLILLLYLFKNIGTGFMKVKNYDVKIMRKVTKSSLGSLVISGSQTLNVHGYVILTGWIVSTGAVSVLNPLRTISKTFVQLVNIISKAAMPEISAALVTKADSNGIKKYINKLAIIILIFGAIFSTIFGPKLIKIWTGGVIQVDGGDMFGMAVATIFSGLISVKINNMMAENKHQYVAVVYFIANIFGLLAGVFAAKFFGLTGVIYSILLTEAISFFAVNSGFFSRGKNV